MIFEKLRRFIEVLINSLKNQICLEQVECLDPFEVSHHQHVHPSWLAIPAESAESSQQWPTRARTHFRMAANKITKARAIPSAILAYLVWPSLAIGCKALVYLLDKILDFVAA